MAKKYTIRYSGHSVEMTKPSSTVLVYKIPYRDLKLKNYGFKISNQFIVYILFGRNSHGKDVVYVGKSKNGLSNRPTAHDNKYENWNSCFVLTQFKERTFFNDGTIQYLEDRLNKRINRLSIYHNTTEMTMTGTANQSDEEDCDDYLEEVYDMLFILGLDLYTAAKEEESEPIEITDNQEQKSDNAVPDGEYHMNRKLKSNGNKALKATMKVHNGKFIVQAGSEISKTERAGISVKIHELRCSDYVADGILKKDIVFDSPSTAAMFVLGSSSNGWVDWHTESGEPIKVYRTQS